MMFSESLFAASISKIEEGREIASYFEFEAGGELGAVVQCNDDLVDTRG